MAPATKSTRATPRKPPTLNSLSAKKPPARPNSSILSFFKKVEKEDNESLFVNPGTTTKSTPDSHPQNGHSNSVIDDDSTGRFNEDETSLKRRKVLSHEDDSTAQLTVTSTVGVTVEGSKRGTNSRPKGPFVMDSDSEDDDDASVHTPTLKSPTKTINTEHGNPPELSDNVPDLDCKNEPEPTTPRPVKTPRPNEWRDFIDSYEDEFVGEEFRERRFMEEQARLEAGDESAFPEPCETMMEESMVEACPICDKSLLGITPDEATRHVNSCLSTLR